MRPELATNRAGERVADALNGHLAWLRETWAKPYEVAIATAYFNPEGFGLLTDELSAAGGVRLLLGAEPEPGGRGLRHLDPEAPPERAERARLRNALAGHVRSIEEDRDLLGFEYEADRRAQRLIEWLGSDAVEVRRYEEGFLHGKAFLVTTDDEGVLAGSSNFTQGGLVTNLELNLGRYEPSVVGRVRSWFDELWEAAAPFDLAGVYGERYEPHNPYLVYLKMLYERYGRDIEAEAEEETGGHVHLTTFQRDGLWRARRILERHHGVLIADGVGLGKTFLAGELIREVVRDRRQRVLLIAPAALRDGPWARYLLDHGINIECISFEQLSAVGELDAEGPSTFRLSYAVNDYALVVIDESHAYRNPDTRRALVLRRLLQGSPAKNLVLVTATPVNNSLWDLYYLLAYFIRNDAAFADAGIRSLRDHFQEAMALDPDDLSPERLFDILDAVAVRRTRHFVKRYYPHDTVRVDGKDVLIQFPTPRVLKVGYNLDDAFPGFFERFAEALDGDPATGEDPDLSLARYVPSKFLKSGQVESYELQLAGLLRSQLLKRFESSSHAFASTCERMANSHDDFLDLLDLGVVATADALREWAATDSDEGDLTETIRESSTPAADYRVDELRAAVEADRDLLRDFARVARTVTPNTDPKLAVLVEELAAIAREAHAEALSDDDERDKRKVIVFSYYADTIDWINRFVDSVLDDDGSVLESYRGRITAITGSDGDKAEVLFGFAPHSSQAPVGQDEDRFDLLLSTDVLAEGVNLQQARHIINYDLPWNPMRLVQRHGRIDRIGSPHDRVFLRCFFPDAQLDGLLGLEARLHRKIAQAAAAVGVEGEVIPGSKVSEVTFGETAEEIARLREENAELFESGGEITAYSGEEYRQDLRAGLDDPNLATRVRRLPWGSGSGLVRGDAAAGFIFCARVGDHPAVQYRYVELGPEEPRIEGDTLTCLAKAQCTEDTERVLDDATHQRAYDAWALARADVFEAWEYATDPFNLQPRVPKTMRDAAALVRDHPPGGLDASEVHRVVDALEAPYGPRVQKAIREAMRVHEEPARGAAAVVAAAEQLGLEPSPAAEPLPPISIDDVHLVCWLAIVPSPAAQTISEQVGEFALGDKL